MVAIVGARGIRHIHEHVADLVNILLLEADLHRDAGFAVHLERLDPA